MEGWGVGGGLVKRLFRRPFSQIYLKLKNQVFKDLVFQFDL
jgi:hypothetical protein